MPCLLPPDVTAFSTLTRAPALVAKPRCTPSGQCFSPGALSSQLRAKPSIHRNRPNTPVLEFSAVSVCVSTERAAGAQQVLARSGARNSCARRRQRRSGKSTLLKTCSGLSDPRRRTYTTSSSNPKDTFPKILSCSLPLKVLGEELAQWQQSGAILTSISGASTSGLLARTQHIRSLCLLIHTICLVDSSNF